jgi:hypothetical protein
MVHESQRPLADIVLVLVDDSPSQQLGNRPAQTEQALVALRHSLAAQPLLEVREVRLSQFRRTAGPENSGTLLMDALQTALADLPRQRLAASIIITDGQVHDVPTTGISADLAHGAPLHLLLTGQPGETDRRLIIEQAPAFALVGAQVPLSLRVEDDAVPPGTPIPVTLSQADGSARTAPQTIMVPEGQTLTVPISAAHAGASVVALAAAERPGEPSLQNNHATVALNGIRDRLRVLLISGRPHMGERAWRHLLKADPNVDLIHFTILRSPLKTDSAPMHELALIAFPMRELFEEKLSGFDLVIFDSYSRQGPVLTSYFENMADYVRKGGALMVAAGPDFGGPRSITYSPLADILPVRPDGDPILGAFQPHLTQDGQRHPITTALQGQGDAGNPTWGAWLRHLPATVTSSQAHTLMRGAGDLPLLVVDRVGKGRVGVLLSDSLWLWARGWQGGGPQAELVRRLAHWLMAEPDLEEDSLAVRVEQGQLDIERRSLEAEAAPTVTVTNPDGQSQSLLLPSVGPGRWQGQISAAQAGLWTVSEGDRLAAAAVADPDPLESGAVVATAVPLRPVIEATGGGIFWLAEGSAVQTSTALGGVPMLRRIPADSRQRLAQVAPVERAWMGVRANKAALTVGYQQTPLIPAALLALAVLIGLLVVWRQEGR